ncbi:DAK2 domain-containing protein [Helicovermis profundi]|uniref:DAK2 domain-containing protein n=1 Tax=Helicovermis profundi TaxID=3065157 RepID=A0AAU9E7R0_9FIRM|nr:DAK2 domain-containing protein [Clostridia bacterium S502]
MDIMKIDVELLYRMFKQASIELNKNKSLVDSLNVFPVPDGDTGTNMSLTMKNAVKEISKKEYERVDDLSKAMSKGSLMSARGNSGVILSQIFRGFSKGCVDKEVLTSIDLCKAFISASETAYSAVMKPVEGTILTVIRKTAEKAKDYLEDEVPIHALLKILIKRAEETLDKTPEYLDVLKQAGVVDAGGKGLVFILNGFYNAVVGEEAEEFYELTETVAPHTSTEYTDIKYGYCTEFIIRSDIRDVEKLRDKIFSLGDSMVFVTDDELIKTHIHTNNPGIALEEALKYGELINIKIENMRQQHTSIIENNSSTESDEITKETVEEISKYGFVSVSMGSGISNIFNDLGVSVIIEGGQTMNPSTEDIVVAINKCRAENVIILPNNSNIILAANQAKELIEDKEVFVIPSKSVPQGISSMIEFDLEHSPEQNYNSMCEVLTEVKTIQITYSVRDTVFNDMDIKKDDILGVYEGEISSVGKELKKVVFESLSKAIDEDSEILTIYYGMDVKKEEVEKLKIEIEEKYEDLDVELYYGGQPLYYYIFSIE